MKKIKQWLIPPIDSIRDAWVLKQLAAIPAGSKLLDSGAGNQPYRHACQHLKYFAQDFGGYSGYGDDGALHNGASWFYGKLDFEGDIWNIKGAKSASFDAVLCTEVFEHIPYPHETLREFARLLKPGGTLLLTVPMLCIPHQTPYFFAPGYSKEWYEYFAKEYGFTIEEFTTFSGAPNYIATELLRLIAQYRGVWKVVIAAAALPFLLLRRFIPRPPQYPSNGVLIRLQRVKR
jgi:SAM-dependent methyltransferase